MNTDLAVLGFKADASGLSKAADEMRKLSSDAKKAAKSSEGLSGAMENTSASARRAGTGILGMVSAMRTSAVDRLTGQVDRAASSIRNLGERLRETGIAMRNIGAASTLAVTAPVMMFARSSLEAARDQQEAASMFEQVFKEATASTREWADATAAAMGRSTYELQRYAASFQQLFGPMLGDRSAAAELSKQMTELTEDVSSFYNLTEDEAADKLRAALIGEYEPARSLGVILSATAVDAEVLASGMAKSTGEITDAMRVQARASLLMKGLADAQGDVIRTSSSLTNQQRALGAAWNDLKVSVGTGLIPSMTWLVSSLRSAVEAFNALPQPAKNTIVAITLLAAAVGPLLTGIGLMTLALPGLATAVGALGIAFNLLLSPVTLIIAAVAALAAGVYYLYTRWDEVVKSFPALGKAADWVGDKMSDLGDTILDVADWAGEQLGETFGNIGDAVMAFAGGRWSDGWAAISKIGEQWIGNVKSAFDSVFGEGAFAATGKFITDQFALIRDAGTAFINGDWAAMWGSFKEIGSNSIDAFNAAMDSIFGPDIVSRTADRITSFASSIAGWISGAASSAMNAAGEVGTAIIEGFGDLAAAGWRLIEDFARGIIDGLRNLPQRIGGAISDAASAVWASIKEKFTFNWSDLWSDTADGLKPTSDALGAATGAGADLGQAVEDGIRGPAGLDTHSPSKAMVRVGIDVAEGLAVGVEQNGSRPVEAVVSIGQMMAGAVSDIQQQIADQAATIGLWDDQIAMLEAVKEIRDSLEGQNVSDSVIEGLAKEKVAVERAVDAWEDHKRAVERFTDDFADSFAELVTGGMDNFRDFTSSVLRSFQGMLQDMVASIFRANLGGAIQSSLGGGSSPVGGLGGTLAGIKSGYQSGGIFGAITGGLGAAWKGITGGLSAGGLAGITSAIGAAVPIIGAVSAVVSVAKKLFGRTLKDTGIEATFSLAEGLVAYTYKFYKGGLFRSDKTKRSALDPAAADALSASLTQIADSVVSMAEQVGVANADLRSLSFSFKFSTKGMSEDQIQAELERQVGLYADAATAAAIANIADFAKEGETAYATLQRLSVALTEANRMLDMLGGTLFDVSLRGASAASSLADAFGGVDAMSAAMTNFFNKFYTDQQRHEWLLRSTTDALADVNVRMPQTRAEYVRMVNALDLNSRSGREAYAVLVGLADAFDELLPSVAGFTQALTDAVASVNSALAEQIEYSKTMAGQMRQSARDWYAAAKSIRSQITSIFQGDYSGASEVDRMRGAAAAYQAAVAGVKAGDLEAAKSVGALAQTYLDRLRESASTSAEYARQEARIRSELGLLAGISELAGAGADAQATLYDKMTETLESLQSFLSLQGMTAEQIASFGDDVAAAFADFDGTVADYQSAIESLQSAIDDVASMSYEDIMRQLTLNMNVIARADLPNDVRRLLLAANDGIQANVDFILRTDLPPDMKFLAIRQQSEHLKTVNLIAGRDLPADVKRIALATVSQLQKNLLFSVTRPLPDDVKRLALMSSSELARVVNVSLSRTSDPVAMRLALRNISTLAVQVNAAIAPGTPPGLRRLILDQSIRYAGLIELAFDPSMTDAQRRVLLRQQGDYIARIGAIMGSDVGPRVRELLLRSNLAATKVITILGVLGNSLTPEQRRLLMMESARINRIISAVIETGRLTETQRRVLTASNDNVTRTINAVVRDGNLTPSQRALIGAINGGSATITLGGTFRFDPTASFTEWYGATTRATITNPMNNLRAAIMNLREAVAAETRRAEMEAERQRRIAALTRRQGEIETAVSRSQTNLDNLTRQLSSMPRANQSTYDRLTDKLRLAFATGGSGKADMFNQVYNEARTLGVDLRGVSTAGTNSSISQLNQALQSWMAVQRVQESAATRELLDKIDAARDRLNDLRSELSRVTADLRTLATVDVIPGFASGGVHAGGLRIVGENGPEIEATGPARIWNAQDTRAMMGGDVATEVRALREEVRRMREENTSGQVQIAKHAKKTADITRKWDVDGQPEVRTAGATP